METRTGSWSKAAYLDTHISKTLNLSSKPIPAVEDPMSLQALAPFLSIQPVPAMFLVAFAAIVVVGYALTKIPRR